MKVLVTGAEGYIGTVLAEMLLIRGHDVVGLDTGYYREGWLYHGIQQAPAMRIKDIRHLEAADVEGFDAVVHLAELSNDPLGQLNPALTFEINHQGSVALARACKAAGVRRFVYTSSCSVYGVGSAHYQTESDRPNPQTAYAKCKVLVERDVSALADDRFCPTFLRNATAYGASPRMRFDLVLNNLAGLAWTGREIRMLSDGTPWRPLVHIRDISQAVACVLEAPQDIVHNEIFNVGDTRENYQVKQIAEIVSDAFPGCKLIMGEQDGDNRSYRVSFDKINTHLPGFRCQWDAVKGAHELHALFEKIQMSKDTFAFRPFTRLRQLEYLLDTHQIDGRFFWQ